MHFAARSCCAQNVDGFTVTTHNAVAASTTHSNFAPIDGRSERHAEDTALADRVRRATDQLEAQILVETIRECGGNKAKAARALQIDYTTLHRKLKRHNLPS